MLAAEHFHPELAEFVTDIKVVFLTPMLVTVFSSFRFPFVTR